MNIILEFDYYSKKIYIPDGYIYDLKEVYLHFFEWVSEQPNCILGRGKHSYLNYDCYDFLRYINEEILSDSKEKAYFIENIKETKRTIHRLKF